MTMLPLSAESLVGTLGRFCCTVVDVGARFGASDAWWRLHPLAKLVGFDPDPNECERLTRAVPSDRREQYVPRGLGRQSKSAEFYRTVEPGCSSLYAPRV